MTALVVIAVWIPSSVGLALVLGRVMRVRDRGRAWAITTR